MNASATTSWRNIALAIFVAYIAAFQIGKAIIALPLLQGEPLLLGLRQAGLVISALAIVGALLAMPLGVFMARLDSRRVLLGGLALLALASFAGSLASSLGLLLASRVAEGVAVVTLLICASSVVGRQASAQDRDLAMALSSTAVPGGVALLMFAATLVVAQGKPLSWPLLWQLNAGVALLAAGVIGLAMPALPPVQAQSQIPSQAPSPVQAAGSPSVLAAMCQVGRTRGVQLIALLFGLYALIYFAVSGFLPLLLRDLLGMTPTQAGFASAGIVASNVLGNVGAGALMRRGLPSRLIVAGSFAVAALCVPLLLWLKLTPGMAMAVALLMIGCMGGIPGALTAKAPQLAPSAALVAPSIGFMLQGSYLGQLIGPMSAGALAQHGGWGAVVWLLLPLALAGVLLARRL